MTDDACLEAFEGLKDLLILAAIIISDDWSLLFKVIYNASGVSMSDILGQRCEQILLPINYVYNELNATHKNYTFTK